MTYQPSNAHAPGIGHLAARKEAELRQRVHRCDCGHWRTSHAGANHTNLGGNECRKCDCPLYQPA